jgi:hypothetical protein
MELKLIEYSINKNTVQSNFIFNFKNNNNSEMYKLETPLNPLLDIEILQLGELDFKNKIQKIKDLINNKEYSYKATISLSNFITWINSFFRKDNQVL